MTECATLQMKPFKDLFGQIESTVDFVELWTQ